MAALLRGCAGLLLALRVSQAQYAMPEFGQAAPAGLRPRRPVSMDGIVSLAATLAGEGLDGDWEACLSIIRNNYYKNTACCYFYK